MLSQELFQIKTHKRTPTNRGTCSWIRDETLKRVIHTQDTLIDEANRQSMSDGGAAAMAASSGEEEISNE